MIAARANPAAIDSRIRASVRNPAHFQKRWLRRNLWSKQIEIAESVVRNPLTAVKGCHASGKTYLAAGLPLWWLMRYRSAKIFTTAPTFRQVKILWEEVSLAKRNSVIGRLLPDPTITGIRVAEDRYGIGASSSRGVNVHGFHGSDVLIIADEAPGIGGDIWEAIEGIRSGGRVRLLQLGNPIIPSGHFYESFTSGRGINNCITISAFDTPNLQHESEPRALTIEELLELPEDRLDWTAIPALISRRWVRERYTVWGPDHPQYQSRVLAEFPRESPYAVYSLEWIERASRDPEEADIARARGAVIQVGIDVAGPGADETALCARAGGIVLCQRSWTDADPRGAVARTLGELRQHRDYRLGPVVVDIIGVGYNFALHLADLGFEVFGFRADAAPQQTGGPALYANLKAQSYFALRDWLREGHVCGVGDIECQAQLATILYRENSRGLVEIESKPEMKKRGVRQSPDRAEALIMAFAPLVPERSRFDYGDHYRVSISSI